MKAAEDTSHQWIWAYEAGFTSPGANQSVSGTKQYNGRLKVNLQSLYTWFYAACSEELYTMSKFWEKAQREPEQAWHVLTHAGIYHYPLVLLDEGTTWPVTAYELENEP